jgi:hypothetical protein
MSKDHYRPAAYPYDKPCKFARRTGFRLDEEIKVSVAPTSTATACMNWHDAYLLAQAEANCILISHQTRNQAHH